jgi:hypothetical protein
MKRANILQSNGQHTFNDLEDPTQWVADCVAGNVWGFPERIVDDIEGTYGPADVIEHIDLVVTPEVPAVLVSEAIPAVVDEQGMIITPEVPAVYTDAIPAVIKKQVKLKAEYTIEIIDITDEHALQECIQKRKMEYPTPEEFMNAFFDGDEEMLQALQAKRLAIKQKYPKP